MWIGSSIPGFFVHRIVRVAQQNRPSFETFLWLDRAAQLPDSIAAAAAGLTIQNVTEFAWLNADIVASEKNVGVKSDFMPLESGRTTAGLERSLATRCIRDVARGA